MREMLKANSLELQGKTVIISGSGNVAIYACEKAQEYGANVVAMRAIQTAAIYDKDGIKLDIVKKKSRKKKKRQN